MKILKKLVLINWHYFWNELIDFEGINFLTGKNAAGKSTVIDALQVLLLGDTSGHFFNKAANDKSSRTLKGYLRGELGDDGDSGFRFLRNGRFSSYIACEFYDDMKKTSFTLGIVFDCYEDGSEEHRFFVLDSGIPENRFIVNRIPLPYKDLKTYAHKNYKRGKFEFFEVNRSYQDTIKGKLGGLKGKYFSLLKKAVPFTPITNIESFITEYVCDVKGPIDISLMQENIRHYKRLEFDAEVIQKRIASLENVSTKYLAYSEEKQRLEVQRYIITRSQHQMAKDKLEELQDKINFNINEIARLANEQAQYSTSIIEMRAEREKLIADKVASDINKKLESLEERKKNLAIELEELKKSLRKTVDNVRKYGWVWRECVSRLNDLKNANGSSRKAGNIESVEEDWNLMLSYSTQALKYAELLSQIDTNKLSEINDIKFHEIRECITGLRDLATGTSHSLQKQLTDSNLRIVELNKQLKDLGEGIKPYDTKLIEFKNEVSYGLAKKTGKNVEVHILADLLEIKDERWSKAIEAYLHTQKFYLIVEPEYYIDALKIYDKLKFDKGFYDLGLIDAGKLALKKPYKVTGSLAEEIATNNVHARLFVDYTLGRLMKCDRVEQLREHDKAITDTCMLYQNFVSRQLNPERWHHPYIGLKAIEEQIKYKKSEISTLEEIIHLSTDKSAVLQNITNMEIMNANEIENILLVTDRSKHLPVLEREYQDIVKEISSLDLTWLNRVENRIKNLEVETNEFEKHERNINNEIVKLTNNNESIQIERIPQEKANIDIIEDKIRLQFNSQWVLEKGEPRFLLELESKSSALEIYSRFYTQVARTESQTEKKKEDLVTARSDYNRDYKMSYDVNSAENTYYDKELSELKEVKLPEYIKQIQDAQTKAYEQFRNDFLAKLKSNIDLVQNQISELNAALKESSFGNDRYRFVWSKKPEYTRYYDMITDELLLEGYNISSQLFQEKHKDAISELFRQITDIESGMNADARAKLEENVKRFTDYKTYLNFDLIVTDEGDRDQRLSKTLHKKSGGETQTPFYVSVLASFAQLYRINHKNESGNTMRLIIFDEAFSKMDSERIQESIRLLRRFDLQAVLSAPPEKIGDIASLVDRNLCVIRTGDSSCVKSFDARKLMEESVNGL